MKQQIHQLSIWALAALFSFGMTGCEEEENNLNQDREIFMSNNVSLDIIIPETNDTIHYRDTTSGFTGWIKDGELSFAPININKDSIKYKEKKYYLSLDVSFRDIQLKSGEGIRKFVGQGDAAFILDTLKEIKKKKPLVVSPVSGNIKDRKLFLQSGLLPEEQQPYLIISTKAEQVR